MCFVKPWSDTIQSSMWLFALYSQGVGIHVFNSLTLLFFFFKDRACLLVFRRQCKHIIWISSPLGKLLNIYEHVGFSLAYIRPCLKKSRAIQLAKTKKRKQSRTLISRCSFASHKVKPRCAQVTSTALSQSYWSSSLEWSRWWLTSCWEQLVVLTVLWSEEEAPRLELRPPEPGGRPPNQ